jgi:hypothetical protein
MVKIAGYIVRIVFVDKRLSNRNYKNQLMKSVIKSEKLI